MSGYLSSLPDLLQWTVPLWAWIDRHPLVLAISVIMLGGFSWSMLAGPADDVDGGTLIGPGAGRGILERVARLERGDSRRGRRGIG